MTMEPTWVLATHNQGKVREFASLLARLAIRIVTAGELGLPEPEETGDTFEANAILKAEAACAGSGRIALADDSGMAVEALDGAPGIYSARWAGPGKDFMHAMQRVADELDARGIAANGAKASFVCVLAVVRPGEAPLTFRGEVHGTLTFPPRGDKGFGYDPIFVPDGYDETFAEMDADHKHAISHRARAMALFSVWLSGLSTKEAAWAHA